MPKQLPTRVKVRVTQLDIKRGQRKTSDRCPIARALRRRLHYRYDVKVGPFIASVYDGVVHPWRGYDLPTEARDFIQYFDTGIAVEPFTFTMR